MKLPRRKFFHLVAGAAALAVPRMASATDYPLRPVRIIIGFAPGGGADIVARIVAQWLSERLGQQFTVENRPGASSNIAAEAVVRAPPDGYTLLLFTTSNAFNTALYDNLSFNFVHDIAPIAAVARGAYVMVVNPSFPAKTVSEFIAYAKADPGKINMASSGPGAGPHIAGELFRMMAGIGMTHIPYRGGAPAITAVIGGQVQVFFSPLPEPLEQIEAGNLRALAVTSAARSQALPDVPTLGESVPGYEFSGWQGMGAPRDTPAEIIAVLNREINAALADARMKSRLADLGLTPFPTTPAEFGKFVADETEKSGKVIRAANIKPG